MATELQIVEANIKRIQERINLKVQSQDDNAPSLAELRQTLEMLWKQRRALSNPQLVYSKNAVRRR